MINSYNPNPVIVHCGLLKKNTSYSVFIWGEQKKHKKYVDIEPFKYPFLFSSFELKLTLFRRHEASFYGTFINTSECHLKVPLKNRLFYSAAGSIPVYHVPATYENHLFPIKGIDIPIEDFHQYIHEFQLLTSTTNWQLADDFRFIQRLIDVLLNEIKQGKLLPNHNGQWDLPEFPFHQWQESAPASLLALLPINHSFYEKEAQSASLQEFVTDFINNYLHYLLSSDQKVREAFQTLKTDQPTAVKTFLDHLEKRTLKNQSEQLHQLFLESIGAIQRAPFKLGIRVEEQGKTDRWVINFFIQDRSNPSLMIDVHDLIEGNHPWRENPITFLKETLNKAQKRIHWLEDLSLTSPFIEVSINEAFQFLVENEEIFQQLAITVLVPSWWRKQEKQFSVLLNQKEPIQSSVTSEPLLNWQSIADFDYSISVGGITVSEREFHELVNDKQPFVKLRGKWILWDVSTAEQIQAKIKQQKEKKKFTYIEALQLQAQEDDEKNIRWETKWHSLLDELLTELTKHSWGKISIPKTLNGTLRPYQHDGYSWLLNMRKIGFGACLADDMGLGKTIQTIAYLLAVKEAKKKGEMKPFLLICPTSLIGNWEHEIKLFAPSLNLFIYHGQNRSAKDLVEPSSKQIDIVITSYSLAVRDEQLLTNHTWEALILDEAQHVKNVETKQRRSIKQIQATHRIALTGTPVENRLKELWSIIDLLNDHFLGSYQHFSKTYIKEIEGNEQNIEKLNELKKMISPFLLRRTKQDKHIHLQLPEKKEIIHRVGLTIEQASLYQAVINELFDKIDSISEIERRALILSSLTKLKQICNHPSHYLKDGGKLDERSEKWEKLILLTETIASNQEKALIFTQYKEMGTIIQQGLKKKFNSDIPFLHGSLQRNKREQLITKFMNENVPFFILSLKAGGVGLNLTAATHVIHYDRWWNPAVENQATDRAYRIGQTEDVTVHKLLTRGTLEEKIHLMLEKKQALSDQILNTNENKLSELTTDELKTFLQLRNTTISQT